jgi:hypothetical protein
MTPITLETHRKTRQQLLAMRDELKELQGVLAVGDISVLDRHKLVMEQIRELKESFVAQRDALSTTLPDGRRLFPGQYEALEKFASNNELDVQTLFSKVVIEGGVIIECNFERLGLTTLEGLEGLQRIRALNVYYNAGLTSLKGIPTKAIEWLRADLCGFTGDLSELSGADKLKVLYVRGNAGLTTLKGIPTKALEELYAYRCGLSGDLSELSGADKLKYLDVDSNAGLTSLKGIPTNALERLDAFDCGLTGDLSELSGADKLKQLWVKGNKGLTSLKGIPTKALETLIASACGLTGDHSFLAKAPHLSCLGLENNPNLTLDKSKFRDSVRILV